MITLLVLFFLLRSKRYDLPSCKPSEEMDLIAKSCMKYNRTYLQCEVFGARAIQYKPKNEKIRRVDSQ